MFTKKRLTLYFILLIVFLSLTTLPSLSKETGLHISPQNSHFKDFLQKRTTKHPKGLGLIPNPWKIKKHVPIRGILRALPSSYDLRVEGLLTPVKDQGPYGTCWAFATMGSLESDLLVLGDIAHDFSENNLVNKAGFDLGFNDGGNICMSSAYIARGTGPVAEACDPYPNPGASPDCPRVKYIENIVFLPGRADALDNDYLKEAVYEHGAVYTSMYWDDAYYDPTTYTYYFPGFSFPWFANHAVVIVGWDDNMTVPGAPGPGAWIVRNSWGDTFGDGGYFYVSYYDDIFATDVNAYFIDVPDINNGTFTILQYDDLGMEGGVGCDSGYVYGANVFPVLQDGQIHAVSFFLHAPTPEYEVEIYTNCTDPNNISTPPEVTITGNSTYPGFITTILPAPISVTAGSSFCVVLKITQPDLESNPLGIEEKIPFFSSGAVAAPGQSFVSCDGITWEDLYVNYGSNGLTNVCIKAILTFTGNPQVDLKLNGSDGPVILSPLDSMTLTVTILPGGYQGAAGEYWLIARDIDTGKKYFYDGSTWVKNATPLYQGIINEVLDSPVFTTTIPATWSGKRFIIYYGVDLNQNGIVDTTATYYDKVSLAIE